MKDLKVWIRQGDRDDYHDFTTPFEAGYEIGSYYDQSLSTDELNLTPRYITRFGIEMPWFEGMNYISLFWGDGDAQDAVALNESDKLDFEQGIEEGYNS